jgi:hypothetical protein
MIEPAAIIKTFVDTFDKSSVRLFRDWLRRRPRPEKWILSADFVLRDRSRPGECFAFSLLPYDLTPSDFAAEVQANLPRDLKDAKDLPETAAAWLRNDRHFHILVPLNSDRKLFFDGNRGSLEVARESIRLSLQHMVEKERDPAQIRRFKALAERSRRGGFNVSLYTDVTLLSFVLAVISALVWRECNPTHLGWFCDRDKMTTWCDGIIWDIANESFLGACELLGVNPRRECVNVAVPGTGASGEDMWFDQYIRAPDWLAGASAAWERSRNHLPSPKYLKVVEDVLADATNIVILPVSIGPDGIEVAREEVMRSWSDASDLVLPTVPLRPGKRAARRARGRARSVTKQSPA